MCTPGFHGEHCEKGKRFYSFCGGGGGVEGRGNNFASQQIKRAVYFVIHNCVVLGSFKNSKQVTINKGQTLSTCSG